MFAQPPFTDERGGVSGLTHNCSHGDIVGAQLLTPSGRARPVAAHPGPPSMLAGHQHAPRGSTDSGPGVKPGKAHTFGGHTVEPWRLNHFLAVAPQVSVPQIIGENKDDIGMLDGSRQRQRKGWQQDREDEQGGKKVFHGLSRGKGARRAADGPLRQLTGIDNDVPQPLALPGIGDVHSAVRRLDDGGVAVLARIRFQNENVPP